MIGIQYQNVEARSAKLPAVGRCTKIRTIVTTLNAIRIHTKAMAALRPSCSCWPEVDIDAIPSCLSRALEPEPGHGPNESAEPVAV